MDIRNLTAKDVMTESVVTIRDDSTLEEAAALLTANEISGAPVLDAAGSLLGVVSLTDVARQVGDAGGSAEPLTVRQIMTPVADTVPEDASVPLMARIMVVNHYHRLVVTRQQKPVGIVSSMDLLDLIGKLD